MGSPATSCSQVFKISAHCTCITQWKQEFPFPIQKRGYFYITQIEIASLIWLWYKKKAAKTVGTFRVTINLDLLSEEHRCEFYLSEAFFPGMQCITSSSSCPSDPAAISKYNKESRLNQTKRHVLRCWNRDKENASRRVNLGVYDNCQDGCRKIL